MEATTIIGVIITAYAIIKISIEQVKKASAEAFLEQMKQEYIEKQKFKEHQERAMNSVQIFVNKNSLAYLRSEYQSIDPKNRDTMRARELRGKIKALGGKMWAIDQNDTIQYF